MKKLLIGLVALNSMIVLAQPQTYTDNRGNTITLDISENNKPIIISSKAYNGRNLRTFPNADKVSQLPDGTYEIKIFSHRSSGHQVYDKANPSLYHYKVSTLYHFFYYDPRDPECISYIPRATSNLDKKVKDFRDELRAYQICSFRL